MPISTRIYPLAAASKWDELEPLWTSLLAQSNNSSPFLDWNWLKLWWQHFCPTANESAHLCVAYEGSDAIGALPVMVGPVRRRPGIQLVSVQTLGSRLFDARNIFSEYLGIVAPALREREARDAIIKAVWEQYQPGEFVVGWTRQGKEWAKGLSSIPGAYVRIASRERSYQADLSQGFASYTRRLGSSTRRSLLHLRSRLERAGKVSVVESLSVEEALAALDDLNRLHSGRWGSPAFADHALEFHRKLIARWHPSGRVAMSRLLLDGKTISCLYDLRMGTTQYNIQMGFDSSFRGKVSLGLIHLGYAMERAATRKMEAYDFLAGRGRRSNYKSNLASSSHEVTTVQALSGSTTTTLYRLIDFLRRGTAA